MIIDIPNDELKQLVNILAKITQYYFRPSEVYITTHIGEIIIKLK